MNTDTQEIFDFFSVDSIPLPKPAEMSSLSLAYIGDAVWEMVVRRHLLANRETRPNRLHKAAISYVRAGTQAKLARYLETYWTEEEKNMYRRGRNAKAGHIPKNAEINEYRQSSGFEAVYGYLYVTGQLQRIHELAEICVAEVERMMEVESK